MEEHIYLSLKDLAKACRIELELIRQYQEFGLFPQQPGPEPEKYHPQEIRHLELLHRLHRELDINLEGVEVIVRMRQQMEQLQREVNRLQRMLHTHEHYLHRHFGQEADE